MSDFQRALAHEMVMVREDVKDYMRLAAMPMWSTDEQRAAAMALTFTDEQVDAYLAALPVEDDPW